MIESPRFGHHPLVSASSASRPRGQPFDEARRARLAAMVANDYQLIWRLLRRLGLPPSAADDAAQQVFLIAAERLDEVQPGKERSFAYGTALRIAQTHRRQLRRAQVELPDAALELQDSAGDPEHQVQQERARAELDALLAKLPDELRTVFVLFELEGMTSPEIAAVCELPLGTVASRIRRARELFCVALRRQGGSP